jgi:hypothetical protein
MSDSTDLDLAETEEIEVNPMMHIVAPVAAIVGTIIVRKLINSAYEKTTGKQPPLPNDPRTSLVRALVWTAVITTTAAVAEVAIYRAINRIGEKRVPQ